ncbi:hypothetical protein ACIQVK_08025 [Streptomyces sp. NPDC090493]|uniref:hypothetical protein n=1 Tax=Streptomyces sp. NPDC090493 TaxID=3365964 RepID=UPI00381016F1
MQWRPGRLDAGTRRLPVRIYRPGPRSYGWLVRAHGGSWQAGSVEHRHGPVMDLARTSGCTVVSTDSAGGTLAACAALARRDRERPLAAQSPVLRPDGVAARWCRACCRTGNSGPG